MLGAHRLREIGENGASRLAGRVSEMHPGLRRAKWARRKRGRRLLRLLWVVSALVGILVIAGLISALFRGELAGKEE